MLSADATVPLRQIVLLFSVIFLLGGILCLPLFHFKVRNFLTSKLGTKVLMWIPIFTVFVISLYLTNSARLLLLMILLVQAARDLKANLAIAKNKLLPVVYFCLFCVALLHFYALGVWWQDQIVELLITICFASVLADVTAFFMGNYVGRHKLPPALNNKKSWEGVAGQLIGALIGVALVNYFVVALPSIMIFVPIGLGSILGDLANSYVKRKLRIKDWSNRLPGHGGYIDRFSSLAGSAMLTVWYLLLQ